MKVIDVGVGEKPLVARALGVRQGKESLQGPDRTNVPARVDILVGRQGFLVEGGYMAPGIATGLGREEDICLGFLETGEEGGLGLGLGCLVGLRLVGFRVLRWEIDCVVSVREANDIGRGQGL